MYKLVIFICQKKLEIFKKHKSFYFSFSHTNISFDEINYREVQFKIRYNKKERKKKSIDFCLFERKSKFL